MGFLIKLESEEFFEAYVNETFRDTQARLAESVAEQREQREDAAEKRITAVIGLVNIQDNELKERLKTLAQRWDKERSYWHDARVTYTLRIFDLLDAFTWAEIDQLLTAWREPAQMAPVALILAQKGEELNRPRDAIVKELIESLTKKYHQHLEAAANAFSQSDHSHEASAAAEVIGRFEPIVFSDMTTAENRFVAFENLFQIYGTWSHFATNDADAELRVVEQRVLDRLLNAAGSAWEQYAAKLKPNEAFEKAELNQFVLMAKARFTDRAREAALELFRSKDGAFKLVKGEMPEMSQLLFLDPAGPLWTGDTVAQL